jgi:hypothetical protein
MFRSALATALLCFLTTPALADDLILTDGRVLSGVTAAKEGETWVVQVPSVSEDGKARHHRIVLAKDAVAWHVTEKDEAGKKAVAAARKQEPSEFHGKQVIVTGRLALHTGAHAESEMGHVARGMARWFGLDPEKMEPVRVTVGGRGGRRDLAKAKVATARAVLDRALPKLKAAPFPIPALSMLGGSEADGGLMEAVGSGKITDLTLDEAFRKGGRVEIGWALVRYLNSDPELWKTFLSSAKAQDATAMREWLDGIEGFEAAWQEHVKSWSLKTADQHVDAAYVALNARRMRRAAALFATAIEMGTKEREAFDGLAEIYVLAGESARALRVWQAALKADPLNVRAYRSAGTYLMEKRSARVGGLYLQMADDIEKALGE